MQVRIYQPSKSAMQSGHGKSEGWALEFVSDTKRSSDPVMGWTSADDTIDQVKLHFDTRNQAIAYAKREGLVFSVEPEKTRKRLIKSYSANFATDRKQPWTH